MLVLQFPPNLVYGAILHSSSAFVEESNLGQSGAASLIVQVPINADITRGT